ncbi:vWA domain-containing protein [uncultured Treponema sp.]|uniref:vWA domain-containing protein n=1 Tax=uncultured Treponema sp. TaxID=162155 RepID=UPI0015B8AA88|nr:vWA domain-containing protein [uncultured Treponema sp.]
MKKISFYFFAAFYGLLGISALSAQPQASSNSSDNPLLIKAGDLRLVYESEKSFEGTTGYHLYIRKKPGIESVMLTETTKDPSGTQDNYAYRALEYNPINGDEIRYLNGKPLQSEYSKYSLIDSTAEKDEEFGEAFHIYIPSEIEYGYEWTRHGKVKINRGTFINIRSFSKKYGDYSGTFSDNPFMFDLGKIPPKKQEPKVQKLPQPLPQPQPQPPVLQLPEEPQVKEETPPQKEESIVLTDDYNPVAAASFTDIANFNEGEMCISKGPDSIIDDITASLERISPKEKTDVIFAIDTTGSMKDDVQKLREEWIPRLTEQIKQFGDFRIGLLLYRDYNDTYRLMGLPVKRYEFTNDINVFTKNLNSFVIYGNEGGDIPEAVYEALYAGLTFYRWRSDAYKKIILIGDAEPHPTPRGTGKYSKELVYDTAKSKNVVIDTIIVPDDKSARGR